MDILGQFNSGKRIIVTPGMIELGEEEEKENKEFGRHIAKAAPELVILVGKERTRPIYEGIMEVVNESQFPVAMKVEMVDSLFEANERIKEVAKSGDIILYENDLPDVYN